MKTLLLIALALFSLQVKAQTWIPVPDPNFQNYLTTHYPAGAFMTSGGNFFVDSDHPDIQAEDSLILSGLNISSISGVEAFTNLTTLNCYNNQLNTLPALPSNLLFLEVSNNQLSSLPALPASIDFLSCSYNQLTTLPTLPSGLIILMCEVNQLTSLPALPPSLVILMCRYNQLTTIPGLPNNLQSFGCSNNPLTGLPTLPSTIGTLYIDSLGLTSLPSLPPSLIMLSCMRNALTTLPSLPSSLNYLYCGENLLLSLPALPAGLILLDCMDNQIQCFDPFPVTMQFLNINGNPFTCLPNYIPSVGTTLLAYPLCNPNDPVNNPNNCIAAMGMQGTVFNDVNANCTNTTQTLKYIPMLVHDSNGVVISSSTSLIDGSYFFTATQGAGTYELSIDTANLTPSLQVNCPVGNSSSATVPAADTVVDGGDFGLVCSGYDLGVQSIIVTYGLVFPGQTHELAILAGDVTAQYNMHCSSGIAGEVTISLTGPGAATFGGSPNSVSGNMAVYSIADFGAVNVNSFLASVLTDTTAHAGDEYCVTVSVATTASGELDATNNTYTYCYHVVNSYDPNIKETYPEMVEPGYQDEFTYSIHFQNTGNAPAITVRLADTLDANLDLSTFKTVNASHPFSTTVNPVSRLLTVSFPNIMLPDSASNPQGSIGFIQYRVKPLPGLTNGTVIRNTASIYFDYNSPIITNTTENLFTTDLGLEEMNTETVQLYPNPATNEFFVKSDNTIEQVSLYGLNGTLVKAVSPHTAQTAVDISNLQSGVYLVSIHTNQSVTTKRLIVPDNK